MRPVPVMLFRFFEPSAWSPAFTPSGKPVAVPGMSNIAQCRTSLVAEPCRTGSGSWKITTYDWVVAGAPDQVMAGEGLPWPAAQVYLLGMRPPSA